jgi:hypothetical protein
MATARGWADARSSAATRRLAPYSLVPESPFVLSILVLFLEYQRYKQDPPVDLVHILLSCRWPG